MNGDCASMQGVKPDAECIPVFPEYAGVSAIVPVGDGVQSDVDGVEVGSYLKSRRVKEVEEESGVVGMLQLNVVGKVVGWYIRIKIFRFFNKILHHQGIAQHEDGVLVGVDVILEVQVLVGVSGVRCFVPNNE